MNKSRECKCNWCRVSKPVIKILREFHAAGDIERAGSLSQLLDYSCLQDFELGSYKAKELDT